jgi:carboxy-cis,cis-muconate cyclase
MKKWNSFAVNSPTDIVHQVSHPVAGHRTSSIDIWECR